MSYNLYTQKYVAEIRNKIEINRSFLKDLFFPKSDPKEVEEFMMEIEKNGETYAPFITQLESGRPMPGTTRKSYLIQAPELGPEYTLQARDYFERPVGEQISERTAVNVAKRIKSILEQQEREIVNKEELMVAQFMTTGKVISIGKDSEYEVDYEVANIGTLAAGEQWDEATGKPKESLKKMIAEAEACGQKVQAVVMGWEAAQCFEKALQGDREFSTDNQSEFVKKVLRESPGVIWLGTYKTFGCEVFQYYRKVADYEGTQVELIPSNMVCGGPIEGTMLYGAVINTLDTKSNPIKVGSRFSWKDTSNPKTQKVVTNSRPVLQPCNPDGYFSYEVL